MYDGNRMVTADEEITQRQSDPTATADTTRCSKRAGASEHFFSFFHVDGSAADHAGSLA